jgi:hypothetical protein
MSRSGCRSRTRSATAYAGSSADSIANRYSTGPDSREATSFSKLSSVDASMPFTGTRTDSGTGSAADSGGSGRNLDAKVIAAPRHASTGTAAIARNIDPRIMSRGYGDPPISTEPGGRASGSAADPTPPTARAGVEDPADACVESDPAQIVNDAPAEHGTSPRVTASIDA